jgi:two-component system, LytTR family, response regulator LytT
VTRLSILAIDDEAPSLDELSYLLERSPLVERVAVARSATDGLRHLREEDFDAVLLDVRMPGLDGLELAHVLSRFADPPSVVFVTAHEDHALEAFEVGAAGYLLKPVDAERLDRVLRRALRRDGETIVGEPAVGRPLGPRHAGDVVVVDTGPRTLLLRRSDILWVESAGDYVRLHLRDGGSHLLRTPMAVLEEEWADGFARVHRSYLVSVSDITELRTDGSHSSVRLPGQDLPVSRRHLHELRERLVRWARPGVD